MGDVNDEYYMRMAIAQASCGDWPYGAVLVNRDEVVVKAFNTVARDQDVTAHAEINVIRKALQEVSGLSLNGMTLYSTGESCPMCAGAAVWAGISRIVYGMSVQQLNNLGQPQIVMSSEPIINAADFVDMQVRGGVLTKEIEAVVKQWEINQQN